MSNRRFCLDSPRCKSNQEETVYVSKGESIRVTCEVDASPVIDVTYHWSLNGVRTVIDEAFYASLDISGDPLRNTITYRPLGDQVR